MAQHTIWVRNGISTQGGGKGFGGGSGGRNIKTSSKGSYTMINKTFSTFTNTGKQMLSKGSQSQAYSGALIGAAKGVPIVAAALVIAKAVVSGVNIYNNIQSARTGNTIKQGNTKKGLEYITSFGGAYFSGAVSNHLYRKKEVERENLANDRNRQLYNLNTYGKKYKGY